MNLNINNIEGSSLSFVFLSSNPNVSVEIFEILVRESLASNKNAFREASAILNELLQMNEISKEDYENGMKLFVSKKKSANFHYIIMEKILSDIEKNTRLLPQVPLEIKYNTNYYTLNILKILLIYQMEIM